MTKVAIHMSMSLGGFVAGPDDSRADQLGGHGGTHLFDRDFSGNEEYGGPPLRPRRAPTATRWSTIEIIARPPADPLGTA
jgi:hypothetical protein